MLTIRAAQSPAYYERREFALDDYYAEDGRAVGEWVGRGSEGLGLQGTPDQGQLGQLLGGEHPTSGDRLEGLRHGRRNVGFDLTWTAPKSVSVLLSIGDEHLRSQVLAAQEAGVRAGLDYLERYECQARRGAGGQRIVEAAGFAGAMYHHELSRAGDPHLHTHNVIANAVQGPDGRWTAPDMRPVFAAAKTAGTIAEAAMRQELTRRLGVEWGPVRNGTAELAAVPAGVLLEFSTRRAEIVELALARGAESIQAVGAVRRETRDQKPHLDRDLAVDAWRARAAEHGLGRLEIDQLLYQCHPRQLTLAEQADLAERLAGPTGLTERASTFDRRAVLRAYAEAHQQGVALPDLERHADAWLTRRAIQIDLRSPEIGQRATWTTPEMLGAERRLLDLACRRERGVRAPMDVIETVLRTRPEVGRDQAAAVAHLAGSDDPVRVMVARAGTGKTYTLGLVRDAFEHAGIDVAGCSWQGEAAQILQRDAGIPSRTIAGLLAQAERGGGLSLPPRSVLVVDEAGTVPTRALTQLIEHAAARDVTVLLVGDPRQLPSIEAGGALASLAMRLGSVELTENRRQQIELHREVAARLADQRPRDALDLLVEHDGLHAHPTREHALEALATRWAKENLPDPSRSLIIAHDRADVAELNLRARLQMDHARLLGEERLAASGREWAVGDRLVCRHNDYRPDVDVRNGTRATVTALDPERGALGIRTDDGREIRLPSDYLEHAHHGYRDHRTHQPRRDDRPDLPLRNTRSGRDGVGLRRREPPPTRPPRLHRRARHRDRSWGARARLGTHPSQAPCHRPTPVSPAPADRGVHDRRAASEAGTRVAEAQRDASRAGASGRRAHRWPSRRTRPARRNRSDLSNPGGSGDPPT